MIVEIKKRMEMIAEVLGHADFFIEPCSDKAEEYVVSTLATECIDGCNIDLRLHIDDNGYITSITEDTYAILHFFAFHQNSKANEDALSKIAAQYRVCRDDTQCYVDDVFDIFNGDDIEVHLLDACERLVAAVQCISVYSEALR